jgi:hypothetical protein
VIYETSLADALFVNWAVPAGSLPSPPDPLRLERLVDGGVESEFVTVVLFRQRGLRLAAMPWPRLSFLQCNLRIPVRDGDGAAAVWLLKELVPAWVVPLARGLGRQPVSAAIFDLRSSPGGGEWRWTIHAGRALALTARPGAPAATRPRVGDWAETVGFFRDRPRAYVGGPERRRIETAHPSLEGVPMAVEPAVTDWLATHLPAVDPAAWRAPHSAFLVPAARLTFAVDRALVPAVAAHAPVPG